MEDVLDPRATTTAADVVKRAHELAPRLRERIAETEQMRYLPEATMRDGVECGIFSLLLPRELGGAGGGVREFVDVLRALAGGDPSAAWTMAFFAAHNYMLARWPEGIQRQVFADGPQLVAIAVNPPGRAERVAGGYKLSGRWGYCSGVLNADWVQLAGRIEGENELRLFMLARDQVEVPDTWHMAGMKGTGSNDVIVREQFVAEAFSLDLGTAPGRDNPGAELYPEPLYTYDVRDLLVFLVPSLLLGAAETIVDDYRSRLDTRRAAYSGQLTGDTATGQVRYARAFSQLRSAQAVLDAAVRTTESANAATGERLGDELRAQLKLDCLSIGRLAAEAIRLAVRGSGAAIYRTSDHTQHFLRDVDVMLAHLTIDEDGILTQAGRILLGRATEPHPTRNFT
ncbi:acyl-CoA dehydrogenase family protein [Nocardia exalbida]|uniref:acyl-CoA dehydrogenase family protein n=1 Tax=Nocardia exalbida TaxID=290231 RepID=UPI0002DD17ED|nr:acyl-CoA dehydrogenase family protein [Nocardia exalbida]